MKGFLNKVQKKIGGGGEEVPMSPSGAVDGTPQIKKERK